MIWIKSWAPASYCVSTLQLSPNGIPICDGCSLQQFHNPTLAGRGLSVDFCSILGRASRLMQIWYVIYLYTMYSKPSQAARARKIRPRITKKHGLIEVFVTVLHIGSSLGRHQTQELIPNFSPRSQQNEFFLVFQGCFNGFCQTDSWPLAAMAQASPVTRSASRRAAREVFHLPGTAGVDDYFWMRAGV